MGPVSCETFQPLPNLFHVVCLKLSHKLLTKCNCACTDEGYWLIYFFFRISFKLHKLYCHSGMRVASVYTLPPVHWVHKGVTVLFLTKAGRLVVFDIWKKSRQEILFLLKHLLCGGRSHSMQLYRSSDSNFSGRLTVVSNCSHINLYGTFTNT